MIKNFYCRGFRNVNCMDLKVANNNILIGENSSGKTNFLCALTFVYNMVSKPMIERTGFLSEVSRNSWNIANKFSADTICSFYWVFELGGKTFEYGLKFHTGEKREDFYILIEELKVNGVEYIKTNGELAYFSTGTDICKDTDIAEKLVVEVDNTETILLQFNGLFFRNKKMGNSSFISGEIRRDIEELKRYLNLGVSYYSCSGFNVKELCRDINISDDDILNIDGSNFANVFRRLQDSDSTFKDRYIKLLSRFDSCIHNIRVNEYRGKVWIEVGVKWTYIPLKDMGSGTIHLMVLLLLLCQKNKSLLILEEPETNLSTFWIEMIADELLKHNSQCFISTHSTKLYSHFVKGCKDKETASFVCKVQGRADEDNVTGNMII